MIATEAQWQIEGMEECFLELIGFLHGTADLADAGQKLDWLVD